MPTEEQGLADEPGRPAAGVGGQLEAVGMTVFRTTEHNDTDPRWSGSAMATLGDLPAVLREPFKVLEPSGAHTGHNAA